ncbi:hypothetical protein B0H34DRAFT_678718 [Crassisporium funariophilum]|nr:hypothetical protein B0H34DRAFT_678718 [Crassisporium funariophilum]
MSNLQIKVVPFNVLVYNDSGSGAHKDLSTWKPNLKNLFNWKYLGPAASNGSDDCVGIIVRQTTEFPVLAPIHDWVEVWDDSGSHKRDDFALWRGIPEDAINYVVVGGFFVRSHEKPTSSDSAGMMAIHKDFLLTVTHGREIWNDHGTKAKADGAVWEISTAGYLDAISTGAFVPVQGYNNPPLDTYALNRLDVTT